jgi:hypothetical protein
MDEKLRVQLLWIIGALGLVTLLGSFIKMHRGFESPENTRLIVIVFVLTLIALFALAGSNYLTFGVSIFVGVILGIGIGYLLKQWGKSRR